jgi:hypothetical protein
MSGHRDRWLCLLLVAACGPGKPQAATGDGTGDATGADTTATPSSASATSTASATTTPASESSTSTSEPGSDSTGPDFPPPMTCAELNNFPAEQCDVDWAKRTGAACNPWVDDCGPGAACREYLDVPPTCMPLPARPKPAFAPCRPEAFDCDKGLSCNGHCIPQCTCHPLRPHCADPDSICTGYGDPDRPPASCYPLCDVLEPACPETLPSCRPNPPGPVCITELPNLAPLGEPCPLGGADCVAGLSCTEGAPMCDDGPCCSPLCPLDDATACAEFGPEYMCGEPLCYANVGICRRR